MSGTWRSWGIEGGPAAGFRGNLHGWNGGLLRHGQQGSGCLLVLSMARRSHQLFTGSRGKSGVFSEQRVRFLPSIRSSAHLAQNAAVAHPGRQQCGQAESPIRGGSRGQDPAPGLWQGRSRPQTTEEQPRNLKQFGRVPWRLRRGSGRSAGTWRSDAQSFRVRRGPRARSDGAGWPP